MYTYRLVKHLYTILGVPSRYCWDTHRLASTPIGFKDLVCLGIWDAPNSETCQCAQAIASHHLEYRAFIRQQDPDLTGHAPACARDITWFYLFEELNPIKSYLWQESFPNVAGPKGQSSSRKNQKNVLRLDETARWRLASFPRVPIL